MVLMLSVPSFGQQRPAYFTGSHTWNSVQDVTDAWFTPNLISKSGYITFLDFLVSQNHNFTRLWILEHAWDSTYNTKVSPHPWPRTGPGTALDGLPKFNLNQFNTVLMQILIMTDMEMNYIR
jgi:hypothetical protein